MDKSLGVKRAMERYLLKQEKLNRPRQQKKNKKPEDEIRKKIFLYLKSVGFYPLIVESKAVYSVEAGKYLTGQVQSGTSDIIAIAPAGYFVAIEVKAKSKRSTLKSHQKEFLKEIIHRNGFASCSDSLEHFQNLFESWLRNPSKLLLINDLPILACEKDTGPLFTEY